jgi:hypothetical protein
MRNIKKFIFSQRIYKMQKEVEMTPMMFTVEPLNLTSRSKYRKRSRPKKMFFLLIGLCAGTLIITYAVHRPRNEDKQERSSSVVLETSPPPLFPVLESPPNIKPPIHPIEHSFEKITKPPGVPLSSIPPDLQRPFAPTPAFPSESSPILNLPTPLHPPPISSSPKTQPQLETPPAIPKSNYPKVSPQTPYPNPLETSPPPPSPNPPGASLPPPNPNAPKTELPPFIPTSDEHDYSSGNVAPNQPPSEPITEPFIEPDSGDE